MVSEVVSTAHCAWIDDRVKELGKKASIHGALFARRWSAHWGCQSGGDCMAELKMGEFGVSKYGEAIYIAGSVLHPPQFGLDRVNSRVPSIQ
jgi:hypothetical protein